MQVESDQPIALVAIKSIANEIGDLLMTTLPVALPREVSMMPQIFPHIADGMGFKTRIILENPTSETITGSISFRSSQGVELPLSIGGGRSTEFAYSIGPNGVQSLTTSGQADLAVGYATVKPARGPAPAGSALFTYSQGGVTVSEAGVGSSPLMKRARLFVERGEKRNTGLAVANPNAQPARVNAVLRSRDARQEIARVAFTISPRGHIAKFVNEILDRIPESFTGVLDLESDLELSVISIRSTINERGHLLLSTLPVADLTASTAGRMLFFPHFADGTGFKTEAILINPSDTTIGGTLSFFSGSGPPI